MSRPSTRSCCWCAETGGRVRHLAVFVTHDFGVVAELCAISASSIRQTVERGGAADPRRAGASLHACAVDCHPDRATSFTGIPVPCPRRSSRARLPLRAALRRRAPSATAGQPPQAVPPPAPKVRCVQYA